jgi:hypothetical protein
MFRIHCCWSPDEQPTLRLKLNKEIQLKSATPMPLKKEIQLVTKTTFGKAKEKI